MCRIAAPSQLLSKSLVKADCCTLQLLKAKRQLALNRRKPAAKSGHYPPALQFAIAADQIVRGTVVLELRRRLTFEFGDDALGQFLAELHAPLVEGIDVPNRALREDDVFVKRDERAEHFRCEPFGEDRVGRSVALEDAMR